MSALISSLLWAVWLVTAQEPAAGAAPAEVPTQRPKSLGAWEPRATGAPTTEAPTASPTTEAPPAATQPSGAAAPATGEIAPVPPPGAGTEAAPASGPSEQVATPRANERPGPPFYTAADMQALRRRYGLDPNPPTVERTSRWRCLIADPTCGLVVEIQATSGYAYRVRQGDVGVSGDIYRWHSARVAYDVWVSIPTLVEHSGGFKYTRVSLGPKGGVIASDNKDVWGNVGFAGRYWFRRGRWSPTFEFSSGLAFRIAGIDKLKDRFDNVRSPIGFVADFGVGIGGFGAIVIGGQFDSPLAREDVAEKARTPAAGMFFIGFRGNILWGAPAALGVATHAAALRAVRTP